ncbi:MAG TPA: hypothetical protein PLI09_02025 [Candidatus Hydrogenedentes bacterium]|nr:hypothetical protein [Candidatus Hydrogenedentota bacterium]
MALTNTEFEAILSDTTKYIEGDIEWMDDEDHSPSVEFRAEVISGPGYPLFVRGSYNRLAQTLSYMLILKSDGRIYGLDLGKEHHNPTCQHVGETHKHKWTDTYRDKHAYVPDDITADVADPVMVWRQFCKEASIQHAGTLAQPPSVQTEIWI